MTDDHAAHYLRQMHSAETRDELDQVAIDIDYDRWEKMDWTTDEAAMNRLRNYYAWKREKVK